MQPRFLRRLRGQQAADAFRGALRRCSQKLLPEGAEGPKSGARQIETQIHASYPNYTPSSSRRYLHASLSRLNGCRLILQSHVILLTLFLWVEYFLFTEQNVIFPTQILHQILNHSTESCRLARNQNAPVWHTRHPWNLVVCSAVSRVAKLRNFHLCQHFKYQYFSLRIYLRSTTVVISFRPRRY